MAWASNYRHRGAGCALPHQFDGLASEAKGDRGARSKAPESDPLQCGLNDSFRFMPALTEAVYWCARDLQGLPIGNHHFILLIYPDDLNRFEIPPIKEDMQNGRVLFYTIGAFKGDDGHPDLLTAKVNNESDVKSVLEYLCPVKYTSPIKPDLDFEPHMINPSTDSISSFRDLVVKLTKIYQSKGQVVYSVRDANCASWINTLFYVAGVGDAELKAAGDFLGVDGGEDSLIPDEYFKA